MKKNILTLFMVAYIASVAAAQFTIGSTSLTFTGHDVPASNTDGQFYLFQPNGSVNGGPANFYTDNACANAGSQGDGASFDLGGYAPQAYDATIAQSDGGAGRSEGILIAGGGIRRVYIKDGSNNCNPSDPSFGFYTGQDPANSSTSGPGIDLSLAANQKISFNYEIDNSINFELQMYFDVDYTPTLLSAPVTLTGGSGVKTFTLDFSSYVIDNNNMSAIKQIAFIYPNTAKSGSVLLSIDNIKLGSILSGIAKASAIISSSKIYPNPATDRATVELNLKSISEVKVTISDLMGKQVAMVAEGRYSALNTSVDVSSLEKGMYTVNYFVNGTPVKAELLMVK